MKYCLLVVSLFVLACNDHAVDPGHEIIGKWGLVEQLVDPGNGSGTFNPVVSNKTITFKKNGKFESNESMCFIGSAGGSAGKKGTYNTTEMSIQPKGCDYDTPIFGYELSESHLIIYYLCIEGCAEKYERR